MFKILALSVFLTVLALASSQPFDPEELNTATCRSGKRRGNACCLSTCPVCGGPECNTGGLGQSCCVTRIRASGRDCSVDPPPCVIPEFSPPPSRIPRPSQTSSPIPSRFPTPNDPRCLTGIIGILNGVTVCCARRCGQCGGAMCGRRPGGAAECCKPAIVSAGVSCNVARPPCIVTPLIGSPSPIPPVVNPPDPTCARGFLGVLNGVRVCCSRSCGQCGGGMCAERPGGRDACCIPRIIRVNVSCRVRGPPCVLSRPGDSVSPSPTPFVGPDPRCFFGIRADRPRAAVCCSRRCGTCGGMMCADAPGGLTECCINKILSDGNPCSRNSAPCVIFGPGIPLPSTTPSRTPSPVVGDPTCATGIRGVRRDGVAACCASSCGQCGGRLCGELPGGVASCCINNIVDNQPSCNFVLPPCNLPNVNW